MYYRAVHWIILNAEALRVCETRTHQHAETSAAQEKSVATAVRSLLLQLCILQQ
jgi:hypothetical protein